MLSQVSRQQKAELCYTVCWGSFAVTSQLARTRCFLPLSSLRDTLADQSKHEYEIFYAHENSTEQF